MSQTYLLTPIFSRRSGIVMRFRIGEGALDQGGEAETLDILLS
jgi:hypothetical protein